MAELTPDVAPVRATSEALFERARRVIPGGVNSPVRAFKRVGGTPVFIARAAGAYLYDEDDHRYLDFVGSWGPMILGHGHPKVVEAVREAAGRGFSFGAPTRGEILLAEAIVERVPGIDMVRLVNSGTEATMSAIRVARAATERDRFVKFDGCYHGHADGFLVAAGSGTLDIGHPDSPGVPRMTAADTLVARFNDLASVEALFYAYPGEISAVIVEPVGGNAGCIPPVHGFLEGLRSLCTRHGALLVFDEVMTGFRIARGGAIERFGVRPDLVTFGKVIGGGFPIGAYAGSSDLMRYVAPAGPVYQAGTLSGNPVAVAAGRATLELLDEAAYDRLETLGDFLESRLQEAIGPRPVTIQRVGSMFSLFFRPQPVLRVDDATSADVERFARFFHGLLDDGYYLAPSPFESSFLSLAHDEERLAGFAGAVAHRLDRVFETA